MTIVIKSMLGITDSWVFLIAELPFRAEDPSVQLAPEQDRCRHGYRRAEVRQMDVTLLHFYMSNIRIETDAH